MINFLSKFGFFLEELSKQKDKILFVFIKKYWPKAITPNHLTILRIIISLVLFIILFNFKNDNGFLIIPLFLVGIITDLLDGAIARCFNSETNFGIIADPIADRILIIPIAVYTIIDHGLLLFFIIFLEIINALISLLSQGKKIFFGSNIFGKTKMFLQSIVFMAILIYWPRTPYVFFIYLLWFSVMLMAISIIFKIIHIKSYYANKNLQHSD